MYVFFISCVHFAVARITTTRATATEWQPQAQQQQQQKKKPTEKTQCRTSHKRESKAETTTNNNKRRFFYQLKIHTQSETVIYIHIYLHVYWHAAILNTKSWYVPFTITFNHYPFHSPPFMLSSLCWQPSRAANWRTRCTSLASTSCKNDDWDFARMLEIISLHL